MDFYEAQDDARRSTVWLVVLFALAVISLVVMTNLLVMVVFGYLEAPQQLNAQTIANQFDWGSFLTIGAAVVLVVAAGSTYKIMSLSGGGRVVAEALGGTPINSNTQDPTERKVLNVVEEMAIASGTSVPRVYLLRGEEGINAFAAGNSPADAVIGITRGTAERLSRDELQGVVAHEFSHILNGDMRMNLRLMGVLHGILIIGMIGYIILRSMAFRRRNDKEGAPILALAVGLMVIGFAGTFFGNLIKASVSRKREFLADASAVQFTRNPDGIAGALKKIGGYQAGSVLNSPQAPSMSHAFFSLGVSNFLQSMFSTHPPLKVRIKRLEPQWDGQFVSPVAEPVGEAGGAASSDQDETRRRAVAQGMATGAAILQADDMVASVGRPRREHIDYATQLLANVPESLHQAAQEPYGARALIYCLLLDRDSSVCERQLAYLQQEGDQGIYELSRSLYEATTEMDVAARLPLVDLSLSGLRELSNSQYERFQRNLDALIRMDERINLFEWTLRKILLQNLNPQYTGEKRPAPKYGSLKAVEPHIEMVLSLLTYAFADNEQSRGEAFNAACEVIQMPTVSNVPIEQVSLDAFGKALDELARLKPLLKPRLLKACLACVTRDGHYTPAEMELMRAIADTLDCPMPPPYVADQT